jgi:hypothetical protein
MACYQFRMCKNERPSLFLSLKRESARQPNVMPVQLVFRLRHVNEPVTMRSLAPRSLSLLHREIFDHTVHYYVYSIGHQLRTGPIGVRWTLVGLLCRMAPAVHRVIGLTWCCPTDAAAVAGSVIGTSGRNSRERKQMQQAAPRRLS